MGFAGEGQSVYPIVNSDLSDVVGAPGLPAADVLARKLSRRNHSWRSVGGPDTLFLATARPAWVHSSPSRSASISESAVSGCRQRLSHCLRAGDSSADVARAPRCRGAVSYGVLAFGEAWCSAAPLLTSSSAIRGGFHGTPTSGG